MEAGREPQAERGDTGPLSLVTMGERWVGKLPAAFDYGAEMAYQTGSQGSDDISAWAGHWVVGNTLGGKWKVRIAEEYNFASGDANPADGKRTTFDQLYPTGHDKMGPADQLGWRNIHDVRSIVEFTPYKGGACMRGLSPGGTPACGALRGRPRPARPASPPPFGGGAAAAGCAPPPPPPPPPRRRPAPRICFPPPSSGSPPPAPPPPFPFGGVIYFFLH